MHRLRWIHVLAVWASLLAPLAQAQSRAYPDKPIRLIMPFAAGGGGDVLARVIASPLSEALGQQVIVDNRPGGGGLLGAETTARAAPDGYTLIFVTGSYGAIPALHKLSYDPVTDISAVALVATGAFVLVAHPSVPASNIKELIAHAKHNPRKLNFGSAGIGSTTHLTGELLNILAGIQLVHVPYKGGGPALADVVSGQVHLLFLSLPPALPHINTRKVMALAVTSLNRVPALAQVASIAEAAIPGFDVTNWYGVWGPKGLRKEVVTRLNTEINRITQSREMQERFARQGLEAAPSMPEDFARVVRRDVEQWKKVATLANVKLD